MNIDYAKNVLFQYFDHKERRTQLLPVLSTLLHLDLGEQRKLASM